MKSVAKQIDSLIAESVYNKRREADGFPVSSDTKHMIFAGPSGTGKTDIAETIAPLYHALGLIPTDKFVAPSKSDLIGRHLGDTQAMVKEQFDKARGGVLFIDEAYDLVNGKDDMYGNQAVVTLLDLMEKHRDDTVVILAGYPEAMAEFLKTNQGLPSRFSTTINFPPYSDADLLKIAGVFFHKGDYKMEAGGAKALKQAIAEFGSGNARNVRNLVQKIVSAHKQRTAFDSEADLTRITADDVVNGIEAYRATRLNVGESKR